MRTPLRSAAVYLAVLAAGCTPVGWLGWPDTPGEDTAPPGDTRAGGDTGPVETPWGTGADGDLDVTGAVVPAEQGSNGRAAPDAPSWRVLAIGGARLTLHGEAFGLAPNDEVLLVALQGSPAGWDAAGAFDLVAVAGVEGRLVTLAEAPQAVLSGLDPEAYVLVAQRVPQYGTVRVRSGGVLAAAPWTGSGGGVLAFRAAEGLEVDADGAVLLDGRGFRGGDTGPAYNCDAFQGESLAGPGGGGACEGSYNEPAGDWVANLGGGGALVTGGGGAFGEGATAGDSWNGSAPASESGIPYGEASLVRIHLGSGGGGVWNGNGEPGPGGAGGGLLWVAAARVRVGGREGISARGEAARHWARGTWSYGAGGGAGGTVRIAASEVVLAEGSVLATGGRGESAHERHGGDGGMGRIRVDCATCNGVAQGTPEANAALAAACDPDPGHSEPPP